MKVINSNNMTKEEALNTLMKMRAWRAWGKEQIEEERPEMPEQKEVDEAFDACIKLLQLSLPSNLDEAAENRVTENGRFKITSFEKMRIEDIKFGAEWMAGQGYTKEETVYFERLCDENRIMVDLGWGEPERGGFNPGDKVIVQIRKK